MKLRQKVIFLAIAPLILALCAIALFVRHQAVTLAQQQRATIQQAYLASKEAELKHYVALATHSVAHLYDSGRNDPATLDEAKRILSTLSYGDDGYFFIYDLQGKNLMHPRQPELVGHNLWNLRDPTGEPTVQRLIERANAGGGLERYVWLKPSTSKPAPKLGYVVPMERWGWMMGTGIYLDDVDAALAKIDAQQSQQHRAHHAVDRGAGDRRRAGGGQLRPGAQHQRTARGRRQAQGAGAARGRVAGAGAGAPVARPARRHQPVAGVDQAADRGGHHPAGRQCRAAAAGAQQFRAHRRPAQRRAGRSAAHLARPASGHPRRPGPGRRARPPGARIHARPARRRCTSARTAPVPACRT